MTVPMFAWAAVAWTPAVLVGVVAATVVLFSTAWVPIGVYNVLSISILQQGVPDRLVGRVFATSASLSSLLTVTGILVGGAAGELVPTATGMLLAGAGFFVVGLYWSAVPAARSIPAIGDVEAGAFDVEAGEGV